MARNVEQALALVEQLTGGRIVSKTEQFRWRPQWFLDVAMPDGEIKPLLLRGWRAPGITDSEQGSRQRLRREAGILAALNALPVKAPLYYGYEEDGDWILMERVSGDELLTEVTDVARQTNLFKQYIADMATVHAFDPGEMTIPPTLQWARDPETNATWSIVKNRDAYRAAGSGPDPLYEFAWWWIDRHRPAPVERYSLCTGDVGANQFLFRGDEYVSMFDVEMGYVGDPIQDLGLMRYRNICYPVADFEAVLRHYYECAKRPLDLDSLNYWSVVGFVGAGPTFARLREHPDSSIPVDMTLVWAMQNRRRGLATIFHQIYGLDLPPLPERPGAAADPYAGFHAYVVEAIDDHFAKVAGEEEAHHLRFIRAHAETAMLCAAIGPEVARRNIEDLAAVLGYRPADEVGGLASLEAAIMADPEKDLAARLAALYRIESRTEYLLEPSIKAVGFASFVPVDRIGEKRPSAGRPEPRAETC